MAIPASINGLPVTSIGANAFYLATNLTSITIPASIASIGSGAFEFCTGLTSFVIPAGVTNIGLSAFNGCTRLTSVAIPAGVTSIAPAAFQSCLKLTNVTISAGVTSIGASAFNNCPSLASVTIPASVTNIDSSAFSGCASLAGAYFRGNAPGLGSSVFASDSNAMIYYLSGATGWRSNFANVPAVLWNPLIQATDGNLGVRSNQFGFNITGAANLPVVVEASTNLFSPIWTPLRSLTLTNGSNYFSDPQWPNYPVRYYGLGWP
jgi:hypothetical protein